MVDQTQRLSRYRELIQELNETKKMEIARRTVELFFSFDIVNSSLYKTINYTGWYNVIICGFNLLKILLKSCFFEKRLPIFKQRGIM